MRAPGRLAGFLLSLAIVFGVSYLAGSQSSTLLAPPPLHHDDFTARSATLDGYTLRMVSPARPPGSAVEVEFTVTDPHGQPASSLDPVDGATMHLIAFRHDLGGYQHVYPEPGAHGSWRSALDLTAGPWRLVVDLRPRALGQEIALATDFTVTGSVHLQPLSAPATSVAVGGGLTVTLNRPLATLADSTISVTVTQDGRPVTDLVAAHGSLGHAVVIRPDDRAYLHLHSVASSGSGPVLDFQGGVPARGTYRLYVEFSRGGQTLVAPFTVAVTR